MKRYKDLKNNLSAKTHKAYLFAVLLIAGLFFISAYIAQSILRSQSQTSFAPSSLGILSITKNVNVSAFIGEFRFTLTGYTSPFARVILEGQGIFDETYANKYGVFTFLNRFSPLSSREACLTAIDTDGRTSKPLCLPPFSVKKDVFIGPILLPPTLSVNQDYYVMNDYGILSGKAAPESSVDIALYSDTTAQKISLTALTDATGDYSLTLPTENQNTLRVFSQNDYKNLISDTSNTLTLRILPLWELIVRLFGMIFKLFLKYWLPVVLALEGLVLLLIYLFGAKQKYPLALRPHNDVMLAEDKLPAIKADHLAVKHAL